MIPALSEAFLLRHAIGHARFCELGGALSITIPYTGVGRGLWDCGTRKKNQRRLAHEYEIELVVLAGAWCTVRYLVDADENNNAFSSFAIHLLMWRL